MCRYQQASKAHSLKKTPSMSRIFPTSFFQLPYTKGEHFIEMMNKFDETMKGIIEGAKCKKLSVLF